jgi:hypothetical protein
LALAVKRKASKFNIPLDLTTEDYLRRLRDSDNPYTAWTYVSRGARGNVGTLDFETTPAWADANAALGYHGLQFRVATLGDVELRGALAVPAYAMNTVIFYLPGEQYWPSKDELRVVPTDPSDNNPYVIMRVATVKIQSADGGVLYIGHGG